jgi:peptide/nickel transport system permease protein
VALDSADSTTQPVDLLAGPDGGAVAVEVEAPAPDEYKGKGIGVMAWISIIWLLFITLTALLAPILPIKDPTAPDYNALNQGFFKAGHLLGTDASGRDVLSRSIWGAQASLLISFGAVLIGVLIGGFFGLIAGFRGGKTDTFLSACFNILLAFPQLVLALSLVAVLSPSQEGGAQWGSRVRTVIIAVGIVSIPILARITRANAVAWSQREFVMAARAQGASGKRVMFRDVLPNVVPAMLSIALLGVAVVLVLEGALAIFGLSVSEPSASWGNMVYSQITDLGTSPPVWIVPSILIFVTVLALNYLGDVVRAKFDVRESAI